MFEKAYLNFKLDLSIPSDSEIYNILKPLSPEERRDFLLSAILFYNHSPSFYQLHTFKSEMDSYLKKFTDVTKHFFREDEAEDVAVQSTCTFVSPSEMGKQYSSHDNPPTPSEVPSQTSEGFSSNESPVNSEVLQTLLKLKDTLSI